MFTSSSEKRAFSTVKSFSRRHIHQILQLVVAQSQRRTSFPFRSLHMRVFRKNFIVPYSGGLMPLQLLLLLGLPLGSSSTSSNARFSSAREQKEERMKKKKQLPQAWDLSGPTCARVTKGLLGTQWPICGRGGRRGMSSKRKSLIKHAFVCFLFLFSLFQW